MFGSVTANQIADELAKNGVELDKKKILLDHPIKQVGTQTVKAKLHKDVVAKITLSVVSE